MLHPHQLEAVTNVAKSVVKHKRVVMQAATGFGKTVCFSYMAHSFVQKNSTDVLIVVHRDELLKQTIEKLSSFFKVRGQMIVAGMKHVPKSRVYVAMVESTIARIPENIGMVIIDECHIANFFKLLDKFPNQYIVGCTATPISANKEKPLIKLYSDIVVTSQIQELIDKKYLVQNITYAPKNTVDRANLKKKGSDFDSGFMGQEFSKPKYVNSTVAAYEKFALGEKTMVFNASIEHSHNVTAAFKAKGYKVMHIDGGTSDTERAFIFNWFRSTPDAILCNVGIATTGTDIPDVRCIIVNRATMSLSLWLQMCGRGGRTSPGKNFFHIIDMGGNALVHGDWNDDRNWSDLFFKPRKKKKREGVAPVKNCLNCDAIVKAQAKVCQFCGEPFPEKPQASEQQVEEYELITQKINVHQLKALGHKQYYPFFRIVEIHAKAAKKTGYFNQKDMDDKLREWLHSENKKLDKWHQKLAADHFNKVINENKHLQAHTAEQVIGVY